MAGRTIAVGDIHGDLAHLERLLDRLELARLDDGDTIVFVGDYVDRGPDSAGVVDLVRRGMIWRTDARVVALRGNHEDAWLRVIDSGWDDFVRPSNNGCLSCYRSFTSGPTPVKGEGPSRAELKSMRAGSFFAEEIVAWMRSLPYYHEDEHAIYVHAGLVGNEKEGFLHPADVSNPLPMLWLRTREFFEHYRGKPVIVGHTVTSVLPPELSNFTPEDPTDLWAGPAVTAIDTGCGKGGFLTAIELPELVVYESR